jgi:hypothetical protein
VTSIRTREFLRAPLEFVCATLHFSGFIGLSLLGIPGEYLRSFRTESLYLQLLLQEALLTHWKSVQELLSIVYPGTPAGSNLKAVPLLSVPALAFLSEDDGWR